MQSHRVCRRRLGALSRSPISEGKNVRSTYIFRAPLDVTALETGSLKILDSATGSPQSISLSGMGKAAKKKK